jgi:hypothetical protein
MSFTAPEDGMTGPPPPWGLEESVQANLRASAGVRSSISETRPPFSPPEDGRNYEPTPAGHWARECAESNS